MFNIYGKMDQNQMYKTVTAWLLILMNSVAIVKCSFDPFMDSNLFTIKWQGPLDLNQEEVDSLGDRHVMITTNHKERYRCILPDTLKQAQDEALSYTGPTADELMESLFRQTHCSYRIESYWTYELCHGKRLRQYHETKEQGMQPKIQEYYLGFGNHRDSLKDTDNTESKIPVREVDGVELPYYEVIMDDGTKCDLTAKPRKSHVLYVCQPEGRGEIYELKESSTCEYEVVVLSSSLCGHPLYRPKTQPVTEIRCHAEYGSPLKPRELSIAETEARHLRDAGQVIQEYLTKEEALEIEVPREPQYIRKTKSEEELAQERALQEQQSKLGAVTDKQTLRDFLSGSQCISGGTGWWKHEVCFGKFVKQFHIEKGREMNIYLGHWDKEKHIAWLRDNPNKMPRPAEGRKLVSLYYSNGDTCDLTGKPRNCEVRLKCLQSIRNPHAVILSLAEPEACQYVLTVESALFCSVLKDADENGLFDHVEL